MAAVDPFVSLRDWRTSLYRGDPAVVDRFLDAIDATLPPGWVRDRDYERTRLRPDCIRCYLFDRPGEAAVRVWLQRVTATRVRGGPIELLLHPTSGDAVWIARLIAEFADGCVLPAASAAGESAGIWQSILRLRVRSTSAALTAERRASIAPLVAKCSRADGATSLTSCCSRMASRTPGNDRSVMSRMSVEASMT